MGYATWSVVFGEQPSAAKWNILGTNDSSFNDGTGIANLEIGSGHTSLKNDYKFHVYRNAAQNTANNGFTVLQCDTKVFDTGTNVDVVTNKGRFTAPVAGFYFFTAIWQCAILVGSFGGGMSLFKNGVRALDGGFIQNTAFTDSINNSDWGVAGILQLAANDYVEAQPFASTAVAMAVGNTYTSYFQGFLLSQT